MRFLTRLVAITSMLLSAASFAADQSYRLRVDGLACPYCAYGIEKAFMKRDGVEHVDVNFEKGIVIVDTAHDVTFSEKELKTIINDAGFSLRGVEVVRSQSADEQHDQSE